MIEMFDLLERFGLPVMMVVALGWYVKSQNTWIQNELQTELRESFTRLEGILIKLIDAQKNMQLNQKDKQEIFDGINKKVNIPLVSEAKEEDIFESLFDGFMEVLEGVLSKKK